jgi:hemerythrin-like domain-containing protein
MLAPTAQPVDAAQAALDFLAFWDEHTTPHFREEDEVMLPAFSRYGDPSQAPIVRMVLEHVQIRRLVDDLRRELNSTGPTLDTMQTLGELFRAHIRYEEDVVFPLIESAMPEPALLELAVMLAPAGTQPT